LSSERQPAPWESGSALASVKERQDVLAFWAVVFFVIVVYLEPASWIPALSETRLVLFTFIAAAGLMFVRRLLKLEPIFLDGLRGFSLLAFTGLALASISWSIYPEGTQEASLEVLKMAAIYLTMINVVTTPRRLTILCAVVVLASLAPSIGAINWWRDGQQLVEGFRTRWVGTYGDPNYLAMDVGLAVPLAVAFAVRRTRGWLFRTLCALTAVLAVTTIVLSHSRGGFLGLCVSMGIWAFREKRRIQAAVLGAALIMGLLVLAPSTFWKRNETIRQFHGEASAVSRVHAWETAERMNAAHPLLGVGAGAFIAAWPFYSAPEARRKPLVAHNVFMDLVAELGFAGLLLFLMFAGSAIGGAFASTRNPELRWLATAIGASVAGFLTCLMFLSGYHAAHMYLLFGLAACAERLAREGAPVPALKPLPVTDERPEPVGVYNP
jgi:O-antigen ligase